MKRLVCEMCGGTDLIKDNGVFVCQNCGCKYSVEEARKMMVEGTVEVQGSVQIDNSNMVSTWMKMAESAADAGNNKEAYEYYTKVLEVEPSNWRAIFGKGKAAAWQSTLGNSRTSELYQAVNTAINIIDNLGMKKEEVAEIKNEFAIAIYNVNNAFLDLKTQNFEKYDDKYYDMHFDEWWEVHYEQGTENLRQTEDVITLIDDLDDDLSKSNVFEMKKHMCDVLVHICDCSDTYWDSYSQNYLQCFGLVETTKKPFVEKYIKLVSEIREKEPDYKTTKYSQLDPWSPDIRWNINRQDRIFQYWNNRDQEMKIIREREMAKKRFDEYWKEHIEEKQQYEKRISEIESEIKTINSQYYQYESKISEIKKDLNNSVPAESQLSDVKKQQNELKGEKSKLGLFAGKQKKQLQEQIEALQIEIARIQAIVNSQKESIRNDVEARIALVENERKPLKERINVLEEEKRNINAELTKAR